VRYSSQKRSGTACVNEGSYHFTGLSTNGMSLPAFTPSRRASLHFGWYSFPVPLRAEAELAWSSHLYHKWQTATTTQIFPFLFSLSTVHIKISYSHYHYIHMSSSCVSLPNSFRLCCYS